MVGGRRIVDRVIEAARSVASEILFVANDPEAPRWLDQIRIVSDTRPERGSIIGIHTALLHPECVDHRPGRQHLAQDV